LDDAGMIAAQFTRGMRPYLLQQSELSTSWSLGNVLMLSTGYAMRHYMLGKLIHRDSRQRAFTIRDYRRFLKLEGKYPRFRDLKRRVIAPSIEEVNEQTGLSMSVDVERVARQPTVITFHVDRTSQTRMGRVYVLRARETNYWKIGYTTVSVEERLRAIQTGCPFTLEAFWEIETNEARSLETAFHQHLEKHRAQGEWFFLSERDMRRAILDVENRWRKRPDTNA